MVGLPRLTSSVSMNAGSRYDQSHPHASAIIPGNSPPPRQWPIPSTTRDGPDVVAGSPTDSWRLAAPQGTGRIRVLVVLWRLSRGGGIPVVVRGFLRHFDRDLFDVHVCTVRPLFPEDSPDELGGGITYHPLGLTGSPTIRLRARAVLGVAKVARRVRPDVLHVHGGTASYGLLAALSSRRVQGVIEVHDAPQSGRMSQGNQIIERLFARRLGFHPLVHSRAVRDGTAEAWGIDRSLIQLVPLGIETGALEPKAGRRARMRADLQVPPHAPLVTYVARLVPEKRPELFLEVARRVLAVRPDARFALVGGGLGLEAARAAVRRLGIEEQVRVTGFVDELSDIYRASDVFLSTSRYEGFGLAIAEAMAAGVPVVSTLVGGVEDVLGTAGILEPSADAGCLASHVVSLLDDPDRRSALAAAGRERVRSSLDVRVTTREFEAFYRRLAGGTDRLDPHSSGGGGHRR